jgi:hypothetical protein
MSISVSGLNTQLAGKLSSTGPSTITKDAQIEGDLVGTYNITHHRSDGAFEFIVNRGAGGDAWFVDARDKAAYIRIPGFSGDLLYSITNVAIYNNDYYTAVLRSVVDGSKPIPPINTAYTDVRLYSSTSANYHLELYSAIGAAAGEVSLRFHQAGRWWGQIRATATGFTFTEGGNGTLRNITAGLATLTSAGIATAAPETALHVAGTSTLQTTVEVVVQKTAATGVVVHDYATGSVFLHSSISANFTCNITNPPAYNDRAYVVSLILVQGATPYMCTALQIDGVAQTINWFGNTVPTGTANKRDVLSFSIIRTAAAYTVLGQNATFG